VVFTEDHFHKVLNFFFKKVEGSRSVVMEQMDTGMEESKPNFR